MEKDLKEIEREISIQLNKLYTQRLLDLAVKRSREIKALEKEKTK